MKTDNTKRPLKTGGYSSAVIHAKRERKREEAEQRNARWAKLRDDEKIRIIGTRSGRSARQLRRLVDPNLRG